MEHGALGSLGEHAVEVVGKVLRQEQDFVITHRQHWVGPTVMEQKCRCKCAMKDIVQLMASGRLGPVGVPVLCRVEAAPDREQGTAPTLCPSMEEGNVKGVMSRVIFAIVTLAQPMVTGVLGVAGEHAAGRVMEGRCGGTAHVTTLVPPMGEELVGDQTPRSRGATLTCVLWMEAGEAGIVGASALPPVEEVRRLGSGCVTTLCQLKVAVPVPETLLR